MKIDQLTLVMPYYDNPTMLRLQLKTWEAYPEQWLRKVHVVFVDDCSPRWPAKPLLDGAAAIGFASVQLFRTLVDVRWNWIFCRNLGMASARSEWVFMTDIDHVMPLKTLAALFGASLDVKRAYRFSRVDAPAMTPYKPHPNTWLMTRSLFARVGGYDERFSGFYGTDGEFRRRVEESAKIELLPYLMMRYQRDVIADASTTTYERKQPEDRTCRESLPSAPRRSIGGR